MKKTLLFFFAIAFIGIIFAYTYYKISLTSGSGYVIGKISIVGGDGNQFGITVEKAEGYYKDCVGKSPTFEKYDFTQFENNKDKTISFGNKLSNGEMVKVIHKFINGHMIVAKIQDLE